MRRPLPNSFDHRRCEAFILWIIVNSDEIGLSLHNYIHASTIYRPITWSIIQITQVNSISYSVNISETYRESSNGQTAITFHTMSNLSLYVITSQFFLAKQISRRIISSLVASYLQVAYIHSSFSKTLCYHSETRYIFLCDICLIIYINYILMLHSLP